MDFAGIDGVYEQYASVLSEDVAVVRRDGWPESVYWEGLNRSQERILKMREEEKKGGKREREFVKGVDAGGVVKKRKG